MQTSTRCTKTLCLDVRKTCGVGFFYRNYRLLLEETLCLGAGFLSVCLETHLSRSKNVVSISQDATVLACHLSPVTSTSTIHLSRLTSIQLTLQHTSHHTSSVNLHYNIHYITRHPFHTFHTCLVLYTHSTTTIHLSPLTTMQHYNITTYGTIYVTK